MSDPLRDRVTAILTLAEAATPLPWDYFQWEQDTGGYLPCDVAFIAASRSETPWLARTLLEALDTIDSLEGELEASHLARIEAQNPGIDMAEVKRIRAWQALNGGNESGDDR